MKFSQLMAKLQEIANKLEDPETDIETGISLAKKAQPLIAEAKKRIGQVEQELEELKLDFKEEAE